MTAVEPSPKNLKNPLRQAVSRRISQISESATLAVDARAKALKAAGEDIIGFGAGEPDFPTPAHIIDAAARAARIPDNHRYSPVAGLPELREAIADKTLRDSGYAATADQVLVTNGGKQAVYEAFATLLNPGDEVLLPTPYWTTYPEVIKFCGGVPVEVFAGPQAGYKITVEQLETALTPRTKILLFVSPSNPTGTVYTPEETRAIGQWAASKELWVITDEIYEHLTYGEIPFTSIATATPELGSKAVIVNGVAKTYAMTGWRVGWMIAAPEIIAAANKLQSHTTSNVANVSQRAAFAALTGSSAEVKTMKAAFDRRRIAMVEGLRAIDQLVCPVPDGAFYVYPYIQNLLGSSFSGKTAPTSADLAQIILEEAKVAVVPGEAFGPSGYLRLSYALSDDDLAEGLRRLQNFFRNRN